MFNQVPTAATYLGYIIAYYYYYYYHKSFFFTVFFFLEPEIGLTLMTLTTNYRHNHYHEYIYN